LLKVTTKMITLEDCIGLCGLTEQEVLAIAEHEHLPEIAATALAQYFCRKTMAAKKSETLLLMIFGKLSGTVTSSTS